MIVVEAPASEAQGSFRAAVFGSCRVHGPMGALADAARLKLADYALSATHTAAEALQSLRLIGGEIALADALRPYVLPEGAAPAGRMRQVLADGVAVGVVEISEDRQFSVGETLLQQNFVSVNLVQPHRGALLAWYREVCQAGAASPATVAAALTRLEAGGFAADEAMAQLLAGVRLTRWDSEAMAQAVTGLMQRLSARWIVVGPVTVKDEESAIMRDRRAVSGKVREAAARTGAQFYDPSELVDRHGRAQVLDSDGANVFEYAPAFNATAGEALLEVIRAAQPVSAAPGAARREASPGELAERLNRELIGLHGRRIAELGVDPSGLYNHYRLHLERGELVGPRERTLLELMAWHLPAYRAHVVMRAGIGELALLIAASGRPTLAFEPDASRRGAIAAGAAHLEAAGLIAPGLFQLVSGVAPEAGGVPAGALGLSLDAVHVREEAAATQITRRLARFAGLLVDPRMFLRLRESADEQSALAVLLAELGFSDRRLYPNLGLAWFARPSEREVSDRPGPWWRRLAQAR